MKHEFLYRALRDVEIASGNRLIPKINSNEEFISGAMFGIDTSFPISLYGVDNKVRQHQWKQDGLSTHGISTTPHLERAEFYAQKNRVIVKIDTSLFEKYGIASYDVNDILKHKPDDIAEKEDNEIILTYREIGEFPCEIIVDIIRPQARFCEP